MIKLPNRLNLRNEKYYNPDEKNNKLLLHNCVRCRYAANPERPSRKFTQN